MGVGSRRHIKRSAHPLADFTIPRVLLRWDVDASLLPKGQLSHVRAGTVPAGNERDAFGFDRLQCCGDVLALDARRIVLRTNQYEVVVHERIASYAVALR